MDEIIITKEYFRDLTKRVIATVNPEFVEWLQIINDSRSQGVDPLPDVSDIIISSAQTNMIPINGFRDKIMDIQDKLSLAPGSMFGDCFPLKHSFVDGAYVREIFMPKGLLLTSKIHKITHPYFIMSGDVSVMTEEGTVRLKAPYQGITKSGTKRVLYIHEDTVWVTVHVTKETDLAKIEEEIIAKDYVEFDKSQIDKFSKDSLEDKK